MLTMFDRLATRYPRHRRWTGHSPGQAQPQWLRSTPYIPRSAECF